MLSKCCHIGLDIPTLFVIEANNLPKSIIGQFFLNLLPCKNVFIKRIETDFKVPRGKKVPIKTETKETTKAKELNVLQYPVKKRFINPY